MDVWHPRSTEDSAMGELRRWAALEGKSATMREDLYQRYARRRGRTSGTIPIAAVLCLKAVGTLCNLRSIIDLH